MKPISSINHFRADPSGWVGSMVMFTFALIAAYKWYVTGFMFFALLVLRDVVAAYFFLVRNPDKNQKFFGVLDVVAYISSAMPFVYFSAVSPITEINSIAVNLLAVVGFALSTLALFDLGKSFGVSPANRGKINSGVYRLLRHPMYTGYAIAEFGFILLNPLNVIIYCLSMSLYCFRAKKENQTLNN